MIRNKQIAVLLLSLWATSALASQCATVFQGVFTDAVASHESKGKIKFERDSMIGLFRDNVQYIPDGIIDVLDIDDKTDGTSCVNTGCVSSGSLADSFSLGDFQDSDGSNVTINKNSSGELPAGDYKNVVLKENAQIRFTTSNGIYRIKKLEMEKNSFATFSSGLYYIDDFTVKEGGQIVHGGGDTTVIHADNNINFERNAAINSWSSASKFFIYAEKDVHLKEGVNYKGFIYSDKHIEMERDSVVRGALNGDDIHIKDSAIVYYDETEVAYLTGCGQDDGPDPDEPLPDPIAHWPLDLCPVNGNTIAVPDAVGSVDGVTIGGASSDSEAQYCQGVSFDGVSGHVNIPHDNSFALEEGSLSFWFKTSNANYPGDAGGRGQAILSKDSRGRDDGGSLTFWIYEPGDTRIRARYQSEDYSYNMFSTTQVVNDTWYHVTYTWGGEGMQLYVNGTLEDSRSETYGIEDNPEPIILGASAHRSGNNSSDPDDLYDHFVGSMDDVRLFDAQLSQSQVDELVGLSAYSCEECENPEPEPDPVLVGHWKNNLCSLTGAADEVIDSVSSNHGQALDGTSIEDDGKFCQSLKFNGVDAHVNIPNAEEFDLDSGTLSFWFKAEDLSHSSDSGQGGQGLFSKDSSGWDSGGHHLTIWLQSSGQIRARHQTTDSSDDKNLYTDTGAISENTWYHLVYSWGSYGMKMYLNGTLVDSNVDNRGWSGNPEPITLGANAWVTENNGSSSQYLKDKFLGEMDDLRVYEGQLDDNAVSELYAEENADSCEECVDPEPVLVGHWKNNVCSINGTEGEVVDAVAGNHGQSVDGADIDNDGKFCQALEFDGEDANVLIPHAETFELASGSLSFWFKAEDLSHSKDLGQGGQGLFSKDSSGWDAGGDHLTIWLNSNGSIRARHQIYNNSSQDKNVYAASGSVTANQWYHLVYTWGNEGMHMYLNGAEVDSDSSTRGLAGNPEPIILGANAWVTENYGSSSEYLKDKFKGQIDDLRMYDGQLDGDDVSELYVLENPDSCEECEAPDPVLVAHYGGDVCTLNGDGGSYVDIENGYNGIYMDGVTTAAGKFCNAVGFAGIDEHINIPHRDAFAIEQGAISLWINVPELDYANIDDSIHAGQAIFSKDSQGTDNGGQHLTMFVKSDGAIRVRHQTSGENEIVSAANVIQEGQWHHILYSWGDSGKRLYIDGQLRDSDSGASQGIATNPEPIILGANASTTGNGVSEPSKLDNWYKGSIDDLRIYGDAQPDDEFVTALYEQDYACAACDTTLAHYKFEGASNVALNDENGAFNGTDYISNGTDLSFLHGNGGSLLGSCQVVSIPRNDSGSAQNAVDTGINPKNDIGAKGTISFWYQANESWVNGRARQLFDASNSAIYFYGTITNDGKILFGMEDQADRDARIYTAYAVNYPVGTWVHLAFTWDLDAREMKIYVNGVVQSTTGGVPSDMSNVLGNMNSLFIGDNRHTTYFPEATGNSADGQFDDVRVYRLVQGSANILQDMAELSPCAISVHHYQIEYESPASICSDTEITVKACQDETCSLLVPGTQLVALQYESDGQYRIIDSSLTLVNGVAVVDNWTRNNVEVGRLMIASASPAASNGYSCSQSNCEISFDYILDIIFRDESGDSDAIPAQIAQQTFSTGSNAVIVKSPDTCPALENPVALEVAVECINPATCSGNTFEISSGGTTLSLSPSDSGEALNYTTVSNMFNGVEMQLNDLKFNDVGEIKLHVRAAGVSAEQQFTVKPAWLELSSNIGDTHVAGEDFEFNVTAYGAEGDVVPNYVPGELAFSMERYTPEEVAENRANLTITNPNDNQDIINILDDGILTQFGNNVFTSAQPIFSNGVSSSLVASMDEVGQFAIDVRDNDYLDTGVINSLLVKNGNTQLSDYVFTRFIPGYLALETTFDYAPYCGSFTYRGDVIPSYDEINDTTPHILQFTAKNAKNAVTTYYDAVSGGSFRFDADNQFASRQYSTDDNSVSSSLGNVEFDIGDMSDGTFSFMMRNDNILFNKVSSPTLPVSTGADEGNTNIQFLLSADALKDLDGVGVKNLYVDAGWAELTVDAVMQGIEIREGRFRVVNAVSTETSLEVIFEAQYYAPVEESDAGTWKTNALDSCSSFSADQIKILNVSNGISGTPSITGSGTLDAGLGDGVSAMTLSVTFADDENPTGAVFLGYDIEDEFDFMEYQWCDAESYDSNMETLACTNPAAEFVFGLVRGNDRVIHWREVL
ncbi:LamG domain-containing protein [Planctobacterium marinum]|uniref:Uncharacterized protein n=1 Tax=Planctobacterium marinum TaxID=1631968 RepID=A0AA48KU14_9ALTE|nr:hypothetical protein MACH26_36400 [Planctobacterium marinum]